MLENRKGLVSKILGLSKNEIPKMEGVIEEYNIKKVIEDVLDEVNPSANKKKLPIIIDISEEIPALLRGEKNRIDFCLKKLLLYAIENTQLGYVKLLLNCFVLDNNVRLEFKLIYTGKGIKDITKGKMSDVYVMLQEFGSQINIVTNNKDYCECDFVFEQDIVNINEDIVNDSDKTIQILVIDDEVINVKIFMNILKKNNMKIHCGYSGEECLKMLEEMKYDIVFLDHMMYGMDGVETLKIHKTNQSSVNKDTPIIALTANADFGAKEEYINEGFSGYLAKPIVTEELVRIIYENCR